MHKQGFFRQLLRGALAAGAAMVLASTAAAQPARWEPSIGAALPALTGEDDAVVSVNLGWSFPFAGTSYTTIWVGTNGCIQLGSLGTDVDIDYDHWEYMEEFLTDGAPEFCVANADWDLSSRGTVHFNDLGNRAVFTWNGVGSNENNNSVSTFQIVIFNNGQIIFNYNGLMTQPGGSLVNDLDTGIVVGIALSNGTNPGPVSLLAGGTTQGATVYETWCYNVANSCAFSGANPGGASPVNGPTNAAFNLDGRSLCFTPQSPRGFQYGVCGASAAAPVPSLGPASLALLGLAVLMAGVVRRRAMRG